MKPIHVSQLLAIPVQSTIQAQSMANQTIIDFLEEFGLDDKKNRKIKNLTFKTEKIIEEQENNGTTNTRIKQQPVLIQIPYLGIIEPPSHQIKEMQFEFGLRLDIPEDDTGKSPYDLFQGVYAPVGEGIITPVKVTMKIVREIPEGLSKLQDSLSEPTEIPEQEKSSDKIK